MDETRFYLQSRDWNWFPDRKASFHTPLAHFLRSSKLSEEEFIEYCMGPVLENDTWKQIELVTEVDFEDIEGFVQRGERTLFVGKFGAYRSLAPDDTDVLLPREAIIEMYREQRLADRYLPTEEEIDNRSHSDLYLNIFADDAAWPDTPGHKPKWEAGSFYLLVNEAWSSAGLVEPEPVAVGMVFQSKYSKWVIDGDSFNSDQGWKRLGGLEYEGLHSDYSCHPVKNRLECLDLLSNSSDFEHYAEHVSFNPKGLTEEAQEIVTRARPGETKHLANGLSAVSAQSLTLRQLAERTLGVDLPGLMPRFEEAGWRYQGRTNIECSRCGQENFECFRKPYRTTQGNYEYWGIVCTQCLSCSGLDVFDEPTKKLFRHWSNSATPNAGPNTKPASGEKSKKSGTTQSGQSMPTDSRARTPKFRETPEEILPLPGDPGATRRPGKKREHYRTGEEAELRHIARKHKWWE